MAPDLVAKVYRGQPPDAGALLWSRLAGTRELALAIGPVLAGPQDRSRWLLAGLACDLADVVATILGDRKQRPLGRDTARLGVATYLTCALLTLVALRPDQAGSGAVAD